MGKTLILVVDRDDDFGTKAGVVSPVIGVEGCIKAASALGIADPEDSDTNALYAAINLYGEMETDPNVDGIEVALICGNQRVGYKSDTILVEQLNTVLEKVGPTSAILVGDGAEDEYIYPIVSSRVPIDSVRKVYVKQAPGVEGTYYIIKRMIEDPQKRRRFIAPLSWIFILLALVYMFSNLLTAGSLTVFFSRSTTPMVVFFVGLLLSFYAYNLEDKIAGRIDRWRKLAKRGSISIVFLAVSVAIFVLGLVVGMLSIGDVYTERDMQVIILFLTYSFWFFMFSFMTYAFGAIVDSYINSHTVKYRYVAMIINFVSIGLIVSGILDYMMKYSNLYSVNVWTCVLEIVSGFVLAFFASTIQVRITAMYSRQQPEPEKAVADEVQ